MRSGKRNVSDPFWQTPFGNGTLSDQWLEDRAAMLVWADRARTDDIAFGPGQLYADASGGVRQSLLQVAGAGNDAVWRQAA